MNKKIWIIIILAIIIIILGGVLLWPKPANDNQQMASNIQIISPKPNEEISLPLKIAGVVSGNGWVGFEGQVGTVKLLDSLGNELAAGILNATTEWTTLPTSFETTLTFQPVFAQLGKLVFKNENPSGLPEKDKIYILPVKIGKILTETTILKVYFGDQTTGSDCNSVKPLERVVPKTEAIARAALEQLLQGPTKAEELNGYFSSIPAGSKIKSISIVNGEARVDFNAIIESGGGSCSMASRVAQITQTLLQFPSIKSVRLSVDGRTGDIFQP